MVNLQTLQYIDPELRPLIKCLSDCHLPTSQKRSFMDFYSSKCRLYSTIQIVRPFVLEITHIPGHSWSLETVKFMNTEIKAYLIISTLTVAYLGPEQVVGTPYYLWLSQVNIGGVVVRRSEMYAICSSKNLERANKTT